MFGPKTTDSILGSLINTVEKLRSHASITMDRAGELMEEAENMSVRANDLSKDAVKAQAVADKLSALLAA